MSGMEGRDPYQDYLDINEELESYNLRLMERPQIIVANKMDMPDAEENLKEFKEKLYAGLEEWDDKPQVFAISGITRQGVQPLLEATADLLDDTPEFPLYEATDFIDEEVYYGFNEDEPQFEIHRESDGSWTLGGDKLLKLFKMTNVDHDESIMKFSRQLRGMGVDDELRKRGAKDGDIVRIDWFEFEFIDG
jgi:GTP-binding protein